MQQLTDFFVYCILVLGLVNLFRLGIFMVGADLYDLLALRRRSNTQAYRPIVSVIVPAHNEEVCIIRTVESILANDYSRKRIVVVDDGSTDSTYSKLQYFKRKNNLKHLRIVRQTNQGKAIAINNALKNHVHGSSLIMVLDADSLLEKQAIGRMVRHFQDKRVVAAAANVKVIESAQLLTIAQRLEYVISHRMKRALTTYNMEYIVGGVGSTFRKSMVQACDYYDTDTMTEDIDFTMKVIAQKGNRRHRVIFASDVIAFTEGVVSFKSLVRQRFRWKYGRMQTFFKNKRIFFSRNAKHSKQLVWAYLPFVVLSEIMLLFEPLIVGFVMYLSWLHGGVSGVAFAYGMVTFLYALNIIADDSEKKKDKMRLLVVIPFAYFLIFIMSFVDFLALIKSIVKLPDLVRHKGQGTHWQHVERIGKSVSL